MPRRSLADVFYHIKGAQLLALVIDGPLLLGPDPLVHLQELGQGPLLLAEVTDVLVQVHLLEREVALGK